jgi:hypothetical protein
LDVMQARIHRRRPLQAAAILISSACAFLGLGPSASTAGAASPAVDLHDLGAMVKVGPGSVEAPALTGARVVGAPTASRPVGATLYFRSPAAAGLAATAAAVSNPGSADYRHFLSVSQFRRRFGASSGTVALADAYLRAHGVTPGPLLANGLAQRLTGTAGAFESAFDTPLETVRTAAGAAVIGSTAAARLPASLASQVEVVDGLTPWVAPTSNLTRYPSPPGRDSVRAAAASCSGESRDGMSASQLDTAYSLGGFRADGDRGEGKTIGLIEYAYGDSNAPALYEQCSGAALTVNYLWDLAQPPSAPNPEIDADIEVVAAVAPHATVNVYEASSGSALAPWEDAVTGAQGGALPQVISSSWGTCEAASNVDASVYEPLLLEAATQGQTVVVASGDDGSEGCARSSALAVDVPASDAEVMAVGGTASNTLPGTPGGTQYVWNSNGASPSACLGTRCSTPGASGGGVSMEVPRPSYQDAIGEPSTCTRAGGCRLVPDVAALAGDPYAQYCLDGACQGAGWVLLAGTSLAAPSWGSALLLADESCNASLGFLNPTLYAQPKAFVGPVTAGNNDLLGTYHGNDYRASPSGDYSPTTGLGYLVGTDLSANQLCPAVSPPPTSSTTSTTAPSSPTPAAPTPTPVSSSPTGLCAGPTDERLGGTPVALTATQSPSGCPGYLVVSSTGAVAAFGSAPSLGSLAGRSLAAPVIGIAAEAGGNGYWLLGADGGVFTFGNAGYFGSTGGQHLVAAVVAMAATPDGGGYWLAARDGGVFAFGDAGFYGSMGGKHLDKPIVGIAPTPDGRGYWLVAADGGIFSFGDAAFHGSMGGQTLAQPVVGATADPAGRGYRMVARDGGIFSFGAPFFGSLGGKPPASAVVAMAPSSDGNGYYLLDQAGEVYAFGDAAYAGNVG